METEKQVGKTVIRDPQGMSLKDWIITLILMMIPLVNLIMLIIWAADRNDSRNLFAKAHLIVMVGSIALIFIFYILIIIFIFGFAFLFSY